MLVECQSRERSEWVSHGRWLLAKSNDNTAFAVESGRYGAIGPRHGANLFIEVQTSYQAGLKRRKEHEGSMRKLRQARDTRQISKVEDASGRSTAAGVSAHGSDAG